jgi:hypothetical protein
MLAGRPAKQSQAYAAAYLDDAQNVYDTFAPTVSDAVGAGA